MNTNLKGFNIKSIRVELKIISTNSTCISFTVFYIYSMIAYFFLLSIFRKQEGSIVVAITRCTLFSVDLILSPLITEEVPLLSFVHFSCTDHPLQLDPQLSATSHILRKAFFTLVTLWGTQYVEAENNLILCHHCPFKHILWIFFSPLEFITHS